MIFLSHNHKDKVLVEQFALRLREIFGQENVFYDSWAIQPGDGIIDKMNAGLEACRLFLFFVSKNSLQSNMVKLEWQSAILKAANGQARLVPIRLDDCFMPPLLAQSLYVDLFGHGLEVALRQVVDVSQGRNTFAPGPQEFSNLRAYTYQEEGATLVECHAENYLESISGFLFLVQNPQGEVAFQYLSGNAYSSGYQDDLKLNNGQVFNGFFASVERGTSPGFPFVASLKPTGSEPVKFAGVLHEKSRGDYRPVPLIHGRRSP